jgi:heme/copper-type cytochrome/quinol oxidase subunit 2
VRALLLSPLVALAASCGGSHSTLGPESDASSDVSQLWWVMFVGSVVVFPVVLTLVIVAVLCRRGEAADAPDRRPRSIWLE